MKPSLLRVLLSELILVSFLSTTLVPVGIWADESVTPPTDQNTQSETPSSLISDSTPPLETTLPPSDTETEVLNPPSNEETLVSTGTSLNTETQEGSGETLTPLTPEESIISDTGSTQNTSTESTGSIFDIPEIVPETPETITKVLQEKEVLREKSRPENEVLVQFNESNINVDSYVGQYQIDQIESSQDIALTDTIAEQNIAVMTVQEENPENISASGVIDASVIDAKITELKKDPRVKHVQKNFIYQINTLQKSPRSVQPTTYSGRSLPNDTANFQNLWALDNQGQTVGDWNMVSGEVDADIDYPEAMAYASGKLNTKVLVAILDSGIEAHTDLVGNLWDGTNCKSDTGATLGGCLHGYDFYDDDKDPTDSDHIEHGSHVAGTIGAITNNGTGVVGVSPNISLMPVRVCGGNLFFAGCSTSAIIRGINFAKYNGAKVINMSFGGPQDLKNVSDFDFLTYHAIESFPGVVAASAGNAGKNNDIYKVFPAGFGSDVLVSGEAIIDRELANSGTVIIPGLSNIISVAASDQHDELASFSNYGTGTVDIAAPGVNIYSSVMTAGSGITDIVSGENGWTKQAGVSSEFWSTRTITTISGEYVDLTGALWADNITPYAPDTSAYIQKDFQNITPGVYDIRMQAWCDSTELADEKGYLDTMVSSTGGIFKTAQIVDIDRIYFLTEVMNSTWIDGHEGYYGDIFITSTYLDQNGGMRIKWKSEGPNSQGLAGCIVKSISLTGQSSSYEFMDGTSMAAPHVTGAVALAWSYKPTATISEVKDAILSSSDIKPAFLGKVSSAGRLNISNMLQALDAPTVVSQKVTVSGESSAIMDVETSQNIADVFIDYATSSGALNSISGSGVSYGIFTQLSNTNYRSILSELIPNTTYYYRLYACSMMTCNADNEDIYSFTTPALVEKTLSGSLTTSGSVYLSGSTASGSVFSGSTASGHIILTHPDTSVTVDIPTQNLVITASGTWDGILNAPRTVTGATTIGVNGTNVPVSVIYKVGSDTSSLSLSGQVATISIASTLPNETVVAVYRADSENSPYIQIASCTITNSLCTFTTNHFSVFALGSGSSGGSTSGGSTPSSPSSSVSNTGPGGGSGGIPVFVNSVGTALQALLPVNSSGSTSVAPPQSSTKFNVFKRQEIIDWIQKNKETYSSAEMFETLDDQIQLQETRLGRLIAYDITLNALGKLLKKSTGTTKTTLTKVQKNLGTARNVYIKALFGY